MSLEPAATRDGPPIDTLHTEVTVEHAMEEYDEEEHPHHAMVQTDAIIHKSPKPTTKYHRDAQTCITKTRRTQTRREQGTSMPRGDLSAVTKEGDREMTPRSPYFTSADREALLVDKVTIIQSHARGMMARVRCRHLQAERETLQRQQQREEDQAVIEDELIRRREVQRRLQPRTYDDFITLYSEIQAWRLNETRRIKECIAVEEDQRVALKELLNKEVKLLQTVDRLKLNARKHNRSVKATRKLEAMARPKVWTQGDGDSTLVYTPSTTRAEEYMGLYEALRLTTLTSNERLDLLLHIKWVIKMYRGKMTGELAELLDREADLLNRGRGSRSLKGLRQRISDLFYDYISTPEVNPEACLFH
ncbi:conserved hypothetical protein [Perkinsus marinus ATCC 50983]|uniref:IQ motif and ubiquitin-like domain-containing protein n=1 Tax=Perkinsus marinus (strain ATCC 50983 / TXsc) TaxID=423536 RepID=C5KLS4_PERM5|nr:conserved hypothetical protein [Perkinsus marinus ATCC 50983]EER14568.1 conserved hypothetical protein [Perkinsus marinus ATCC 50983]|eukprot:XP_002782773.1 conserved hypothetical protein [Perkinsus marinus ATCC 50983]